MATSPTEVMTVGEMIYAAILFYDEGPLVDFKMLEAILFIIAKQLTVLERKVKVRHYDSKTLSKMKSRLTVAQLKIHVRTKGHTKKKSRAKKSSSSEQKRSPRIKFHKSGKHKPDLEEGQWSEVSSSSQGFQDHRSPIVTQEQYEELLSKVHRLQVKFGVESTSSSNIHKQISLMEPMAAINLATRLEASNKKLDKMLRVLTKCAGDLPLKDPVELKLLYKSFEETPAFDGTSRIPSDANFATVDEDRQADEVCVENLATLSELNVKMDEIRNDAGHISQAATKVIETANRANLLLKEAGPKLSEAFILGPRLRSEFGILHDEFNKKVNYLNSNMTAQITDFQESLTNVKFNIEAVLEKIFDHLAQPEDPTAAIALTKDFAEMEQQLYVLQEEDQADLSERQKKSEALWLQRIRRLNAEIKEVKITRDDLVEALRNKLGINEINGLLSVKHLYAVVEFMQGKISQTNKHIESVEFNWQEVIDQYITDMYEKCDKVQLVTLNYSLRNHCEFMTAKVGAMLNIFGDYRVSAYKKKLDHKGNCLSCGTPGDVKVLDKDMKFVKRMLNEKVESKVLTQDDDAITRKPCVPGKPIPHPLDPRALVCDRYCGASISKTRESPPSASALGMEVMDINLTRVTDMPAASKVQLTCTPCNHSQDSYVD